MVNEFGQSNVTPITQGRTDWEDYSGCELDSRQVWPLCSVQTSVEQSPSFPPMSAGHGFGGHGSVSDEDLVSLDFAEAIVDGEIGGRGLDVHGGKDVVGEAADLDGAKEDAIEEIEVIDDEVMLEPLEHSDGRSFGDHGRGVIGVRCVARQHEFGHDEPSGDGAEFCLQYLHIAAGVDSRGGELVLRVGKGVENRAGCVASEVARLAGRWIGGSLVGAILNELVDGAARAAVVLANDSDGRLDFGDDAHIA